MPIIGTPSYLSHSLDIRSLGICHRSRTLTDKAKIDKAETAYLLLDVAGVAFALARSAVSEVLPLPNLHPPALAGTLVAGFLNLGGAPVPVVDLARLLDLRDASASGGDPYRHILLAADRGTAFLVDRVLDLVSVMATAIRPLDAGASLNGCVVAEIAQGERLVHVLAMDRLLTAEERRRVDVLARVTGERLSALDRLAEA